MSQEGVTFATIASNRLLRPSQGSVTDNHINDETFLDDVKRLKELRSFLIKEAIIISSADGTALSFGKLNLLQYDYRGRAPTEEESSLVERYTERLFSLLTEPLRRRFIMGQVPAWVAVMPVICALIALAGLLGAVLAQGIDLFGLGNLGINTLPFYLLWVTSLGAIGAVAFIGMNALSVQQDITFDLSNNRLMLLRISLGALFGLVLTLPFGFVDFVEFVAAINRVRPLAGMEGAAPAAADIAGRTQALLLLLPFILGFSTSLVIMILNRLVDAVQAFFGRPGTHERQAPAPPDTATRPRSVT